MSRSKPQILLLVTGSIAAYKACHVVSRLNQAGLNVQVAASPSALQFVGVPTWEGLSGNPVVSDLWEKGRAMDHIHLVRQADLILAAPASAHFINRIAYGIGDDLLATMWLAHDFKKPFLVAPAMNTMMYLHPATQESLKRLRSMGVGILETASGVLACGENGYGRLLEPDLIVQEVLTALKNAGKTALPPTKPRNVAAPARVLITSGGTREKIDDVRFLTNTSTGVSGARLADLLSSLGHDVTLVRAKSAAKPESTDVTQTEFESFADLERILSTELSSRDYSHVVQMAAIADYTLERVLLNGDEKKDRKTPSGGRLILEMAPTPKLIARLKTWSRNKDLHVAGFKLTSGASDDERKAAAEKVLAHAELVVANDLSTMKEGRHPYTIYRKEGAQPVSGFDEMSAALAFWIHSDASPISTKEKT